MPPRKPLYEYVTALQQTAAEHRQTGDPNNLANAIHAISIHIQASPPSSTRAKQLGATHGVNYKANPAIALSGLKPVIDKVFSFDDVTAAYRYLQSAQHFGKIVIRLG
jgi:hypothetical protein